MEYPLIAIVHIEFKTDLKEEDITAIEGLLRGYQDIYHLIVHERSIVFYIWGNEKINYEVLDQIKNELIKREYLHFVVTADEYVKTGQKYYHDAGRDGETKNIEHSNANTGQ